MNHIDYFSKKRNPLPGDVMFDALFPPKEIILAANTRVTKEVVEGILKAAKETENVFILEMALSEMDLNGGYCGVTPALYAKRVIESAEKVGWFGYVLHADHITVKTGNDEEIEKVKKEIDARVDAGFSSYAIDTSFLFDTSKDNVEGHLANVIEKYVLLFNYLKAKGLKYFGKEGEVGEIGIKEFTQVIEAVHFLDKLKENNIELNWLAIANGTKHGVSVDAQGKIIPQMGVNLERTVEIADAISEKYKTRIVQHGTTGTPLDLIEKHFPRGKISKCNVGTHWMLLVWDILKVSEPGLYKRIYDWTISNYKKEGVNDAEVFAKSSKYATKQFFNEIENVSEETKKAIREKAYKDALMWFRIFGMVKTAEKVYDYIEKNKIEY
ncbi:MAG: class II fructose-bisphosphate aldolase [Candidatus Aenigmatarchaeota archaeon]